MRETRNLIDDYKQISASTDDSELKKIALHAIERATHAEDLLHKIAKVDINGMSRIVDLIGKRWDGNG